MNAPRQVLAFTALISALSCGSAVRAGEFDVSFEADVRAVVAESRRSFLDGGLGKLRYGNGGGLELGRLRIAVDGALGESARLHIDASAWSTADTNPLDLTEAYLEWRPVPQSAWRSRMRAGAFYPKISLEHRAAGWTNPYTLSSSALNTWVGEELRTIGAEYVLEYRNLDAQAPVDFGLTVAGFGGNDPAGVVVALRGFALHDRQTPLFGRLRTWVPDGPQSRVLFREIDGRPGVYVGVHARRDGRFELRALRYNNRADPAAFSPSIQDYAWRTLFDSLGARFESSSGWTVIAQTLAGETSIGPGGHDRWDFRAAFVLAALQRGKHRFAARADRFAMDQRVSKFPGDLGRDRGHAWTLGWTAQLRDALALSAELIQVNSNYNWRNFLGEAPHAVERSLQLGIRYQFGSR